MSFVLNTNVSSLFTQKQLNTNTRSLGKSIERLSSGQRINRAGDDAAGLAQGNILTSQIRGIDAAKRNLTSGKSAMDTADSGLFAVQDNLQRVRELVVDAQSGTKSVAELDAIQVEINSLVTDIGDIATDTEYGGNALIDGTYNVTLQSGPNDGDTTTLDLSTVNVNINTTAAGSLSEGAIQLDQLQVTGATVSSVSGTNAAPTIANIDTMINNVARMQSEEGSLRNSLDSKSDYLSSLQINLEAARSNILDTDIAAESSNFTKLQILQQSSSAMLAQANTQSQQALTLLP